MQPQPTYKQDLACTPTLIEPPGRIKIAEVLLEKALADIETLELNAEGELRDELGEVGMLVSLASDELAGLGRHV